MAEEIIAVQRNLQGDIINFQTSSGRIISYRKALQEAEDGIITGVSVHEGTESDLPVLTSELTSFDDLPDSYI
jgi:hypothetical protein